ncbi:pre-60S factor REI1 [Nematocida sp. AWRm77]|nr:pre-60S factor REI1 [Nematocida sp. AWRm77]
MKCGACQILVEKEEVAAHYQSDFHTENLSRKGAGVAPLTFAEWSSTCVAESTAKASKASSGSGGISAVSGLHALQHGECVFCGEIVPNVGTPDFLSPQYMEHLEKHGFYIVSPQYLTDVHGLMEYLKEKIAHCMCMYCNKRFPDISRARMHMESMRHMRYMSSEEYNEYYTYPEPDFGYIIRDGTEMLLPTGKIVEHKKCQKDKAQMAKVEEYYQTLFRPTTKLRSMEVTVHHVPESTTTQEHKMKFAESQQKNRYRVSKSANNQKHFKEDWMQ